VKYLPVLRSRKSRKVNFTNPFINAVLASVLGVLLAAWWSWGNVFEHRNWMLFVAVCCAICGFYFGEPFIRVLMRGH
jgi:hypothetical protein